MATIKEVARRAGVSMATVSYVINDIRKVSPETERRVRMAAKELGYARGRLGCGLFTVAGSFAGLVVPDIGTPFFPEIVKSFEEAANLSGMDLIVMNTNSDPQRTRKAVERLSGLPVAGAAFLTTQVDSISKQALAERGIASVYLDYGAPGRSISNIAVDYRRGMLDAIDHLVKLGHRKIGLIGGPEDGVSAQKRKLAFLEGTSRAGVEARAIESDFSVQGGYFSCARLLSASPPTAVIAANDLMAIGALHCAFDRQVNVPHELSVIGFDNIDFAQFTQPALTTVAASRAEIGRLAFEAISALIADPDDGATYEVDTELVVRQTTAPPYRTGV
jgi:DNA-binding LacI/PurR family transcriptional regulator